MFEFARRIPFGVCVRDFFELERSFAGDGVMNSASQVEKFLRLKMFGRKFLSQIVPGSQLLFDGLRKLHESLQVGACDFGRHASAASRETQGHQIKNRDLGGEALGCWNRKFRSCTAAQG